MKSNSLVRFGGTCSILLGIFGLLDGILYLLLPDAQKLGMKAVDVLPSFAQNPGLLSLLSIGLAIEGILGLAVVPAVARLIESVDEGWTRWVSTLAYIGFGIAAVSNLLVVGRLPGIATAFVAGDASIKAALAPVWRSTLDWQGLWQYGFISLWTQVASWLAMRGKVLPSPVVYLGFATAISMILVPLAFILKVPVLFLIIATVGAIVSLVWHVWLGLTLRNR